MYVPVKDDLQDVCKTPRDGTLSTAMHGANYVLCLGTNLD